MWNYTLLDHPNRKYGRKGISRAQNYSLINTSNYCAEIWVSLPPRLSELLRVRRQKKTVKGVIWPWISLKTQIRSKVFRRRKTFYLKLRLVIIYLFCYCFQHRSIKARLWGHNRKCHLWKVTTEIRENSAKPIATSNNCCKVPGISVHLQTIKTIIWEDSSLWLKKEIAKLIWLPSEF